MSAIYKLTTTLTATLNYQRVLDSALDLSLQALKTDIYAETDSYLVAAVLLFEKDELKVGSARRFTPADLRKTLPARAGVIAEAINNGEPIVGEKPINDPELSAFAALHNSNSFYLLPLRSGFDVYGVMIFAHPEKNYFTQDRREVLEIIGRQAVVAISNARLYDDLRKEKERIIEVQEDARKKLARDLHDGPAQSIAALAMRVNLTRRTVEKSPKDAADELLKIEELARRTTKEIRHMLFTLRPLVLESQGLVAAIQDMATKIKETYAQNVIVQMDENVVQELEAGKTGVIFYIVEEAVNNARKYAKSENIWVRLRPLEKDKEIVLLEIADNGVGYDVEAVNKNYDQRGSLGMVNLRERTELVSGVLNITSVIGKGTNTQVYIPLSEEAQDRLHHQSK
jgi:signal transduction histidine kinase